MGATMLPLARPVYAMGCAQGKAASSQRDTRQEMTKEERKRYQLKEARRQTKLVFGRWGKPPVKEACCWLLWEDGNIYWTSSIQGEGVHLALLQYVTKDRWCYNFGWAAASSNIWGGSYQPDQGGMRFNSFLNHQEFGKEVAPAYLDYMNSAIMAAKILHSYGEISVAMEYIKKEAE